MIEKYCEAAPWKLQDEASASDLNGILYFSAESIRIITALLYPILPTPPPKSGRSLGLGDIEAAARNGELNNLNGAG
jgi:methionyl-tRNA synthetase